MIKPVRPVPEIGLLRINSGIRGVPLRPLISAPSHVAGSTSGAGFSGNPPEAPTSSTTLSSFQGVGQAAPGESLAPTAKNAFAAGPAPAKSAGLGMGPLLHQRMNAAKYAM